MRASEVDAGETICVCVFFFVGKTFGLECKTSVSQSKPWMGMHEFECVCVCVWLCGNTRNAKHGCEQSVNTHQIMLLLPLSMIIIIIFISFACSVLSVFGFSPSIGFPYLPNRSEHMFRVRLISMLFDRHPRRRRHISVVFRFCFILNVFCLHFVSHIFLATTYTLWVVSTVCCWVDIVINVTSMPIHLYNVYDTRPVSTDICALLLFICIHVTLERRSQPIPHLLRLQ